MDELAIPCSFAQSRRAVRAVPVQNEGRRNAMHKTLVVDDSPTIRRMVRAAGFHVHLPKALAIAVRNLVGPA